MVRATPSGVQIKAARALLGISAQELAGHSNVGWATVQRLESQLHQVNARARSLERVRAALEAHGIEFIGNPETNPGVILHRSARPDE